ncbi:zinc finger protein 423 [Fopius arisanus]|uniref:Zinc finger protein 423 n=1 Tax=Fopius arisanus TaxID=64838 RepID=A0A9R1TAG3_9HYME|nr:PREDICTED: zinc finger protein 423-like [Fopius arisanus]XP_011305800.1 PREDICTED: zinc finger protein 423-like [Fopius arisanus]XP_011305801.1 PREDICTED: zinc finger protein 423-like [Fopius arisanus]XP_011305802.1 PREDICTED: zinc finger protein 423-like [Fopius arisanus]
MENMTNSNPQICPILIIPKAEESLGIGRELLIGPVKPLRPGKRRRPKKFYKPVWKSSWSISEREADNTSTPGVERNNLFLDDNDSEAWNGDINDGVIDTFDFLPEPSPKNRPPTPEPLDSYGSSKIHGREKPPGPWENDSIPLPRPHCRMCRQIFDSLSYDPTSPSLKCPFECYVRFSSFESLQRHVTYVHVTCRCTKEDLYGDVINCSGYPRKDYSCPMCSEKFSLYRPLEQHLYSIHKIPNISEINRRDLPACYATVPENLIARRWPKSCSTRMSRGFVCDFCAIKFPSVKELFRHFNKGHTNSIRRVPTSISRLKFHMKHQKTKGLSLPDQWPLSKLSSNEKSKRRLTAEMKKPSATGDSDDCEAAMDDYLLQIKNNQEKVKEFTPGDSPEDYEEYEFLEMEIPEEAPSSTKDFPEPEESLASPELPKDSDSLLRNLLTPDVTSTDSTASEESKSVPTLKKPPKIIQDSRNFDLETSLYLEKLQKDHKSLVTTVSRIEVKKNSVKDVERQTISKILPIPSKLQERDPKKNPSRNKSKGKSLRSCPRCKKVFNTVGDLAKHLSLIQKINESSPEALSPVREVLSCPECLKPFRSQNILLTHKYLVHRDDSGIHICDNCCKILTSISMVNNHLCITATSFTCRGCNQVFKSSEELLFHNQKNHLEDSGTHACPACQKNFLTKSMMNRHILENCDVQGSDDGENNNNDRDADRNWMDDVKSHRCDVCQSLWETSDELIQHLETIHDLKSCRLCSRWVHSHQILNHVMSHVLDREEDGGKGGGTGGDIKDGTRRFIAEYSKDFVTSVLQYSRYRLEESGGVLCSQCQQRFDNSHTYKCHYVETHDLFCVLCNRRFGDVLEAFEHKNSVHQSAEIYMWVADKILLALAETGEVCGWLGKKFKKTILIRDLEEKVKNIHRANRDSREGQGGDKNFRIVDGGVVNSRKAAG